MCVCVCVESLFVPAEEGCLINREEMESVIEECSRTNSHHLSVLREVLERRDWMVERSGGLAKALRSPLTALCARSAESVYMYDKEHQHT